MLINRHCDKDENTEQFSEVESLMIIRRELLLLGK